MRRGGREEGRKGGREEEGGGREEEGGREEGGGRQRREGGREVGRKGEREGGKKGEREGGSEGVHYSFPTATSTIAMRKGSIVSTLMDKTTSSSRLLLTPTQWWVWPSTPP